MLLDSGTRTELVRTPTLVSPERWICNESVGRSKHTAVVQKVPERKIYHLGLLAKEKHLVGE